MNDLVRDCIWMSFFPAAMSGFFAAPFVLGYSWPVRADLPKSRRAVAIWISIVSSALLFFNSMAPIIASVLVTNLELVPIGYMVGAIIIGFEVGVYCSLPLLTGFTKLLVALSKITTTAKTKAT